MEKARIIRIVSNQYLVMNEQKQSYLCVAMGKLRKQKQVPVVGDIVDVEHFDNQNGIQAIMPRKNELIRPAIANVDQALIVTSVKEPNFSSTLLDRLLFMVCYANIKPVICFTKLDLVDKDDEIFDIIKQYQNSGYEVYMSGEGYDTLPLIKMIENKISVLTGQSGAGKSSLINRLDSSFKLQTQGISKALGRGKHTTRHSELHEVCGGYIADTPGFSSFDFSLFDKQHLAQSIYDFKPYLGKCRFNNCAHVHEPGCAIIEACEQGLIMKERYLHYLEIVEMIQNRKVKY